MELWKAVAVVVVFAFFVQPFIVQMFLSLINTYISVRGSWFNSNYRGQCIQWWIEQVAELRLGGLDVPGILHQHISYAINVARSTRMISGSEK